MDGPHVSSPDSPAVLEAAILDQASRLFKRHVTREVLREADRGHFPHATWDAVEQAGLPWASVPEAAGGAGLERRAGLKLVRCAAHHCLPLPLAEVMLARALWPDMPELPGGLATIAGSSRRDTLRLTRDAGAWRLHGALHRVPWGRVAQAVVAIAVSDGGAPAWVLAPAGSFAVTTVANVANEPRDTLHFGNAPLDDANVRPGVPDGILLMNGALMRLQQMVGAMERSLDYAVEYATVRVQFGRTISKFQAVQQMLAEAAGHLAAATAAADATLDAEEWELPLLVAVAKARVGEAAGRVAAITHQVHAAMGFTQEHPLHYATRRLWSWRDEYGSEPFWQRQVGQFVCRLGGEALWPLLADGDAASGFVIVSPGTNLA